MNKSTKWLKLAVRGSLAFLLLALVWQIFVVHAFVYLGGDNYRLVNADSGTVRLQGSGAGWHWLATGSYVYEFSSAKHTNQTGTLKVSPFSWRRVSLKAAVADSHLELVARTASLTSGVVGDGYLYVDAVNRAVMWRDGNGTVSDLSSSFGLTTQATDSYDRILDIYSLTGGRALVVTTSGPYIMTSDGTVTSLPQNPDTQDYQASAYDSAKQQLYMLAGYRTIYIYNLSVGSVAVNKVLTTDKNINRLTAGGGRLLAYYDNIASDQPTALAAYANLKQVTPILIDVAGKSSSELTDYPGLATAVFSSDGQYLALKSHLAAVMSVYDVSRKEIITTVPAADAGGITWNESGLYIGRGDTIWKYTAGSDSTNLQPVATAGSPITRLSSADSGLLVTTDNQLSHVVSGGSTTPVSNSQPVERLINDQTPVYQYHQP